MANDTAAPRPKLSEVVVEIADDKNSNAIWPPTQAFLRGAWNKNNVKPGQRGETIEPMPDLPGQCVSVDPQRKRGRIFDPLRLPEYATLLKKLEAVHKDMFGSAAGPDQDAAYDGLTETQIKTWLYWMRRKVDARQARVLNGELPTLEQIEHLPGKTRIEAFNSSPRATKYREDLPAEPAAA